MEALEFWQFSTSRLFPCGVASFLVQMLELVSSRNRDQALGGSLTQGGGRQGRQGGSRACLRSPSAAARRAAPRRPLHSVWQAQTGLDQAVTILQDSGTTGFTPCGAVSGRGVEPGTRAEKGSEGERTWHDRKNRSDGARREQGSGPLGFNRGARGLGRGRGGGCSASNRASRASPWFPRTSPSLVAPAALTAAAPAFGLFLNERR